MNDTPLLKGLRKKLVEELRAKKIKDENVLEAFLNVPRHWYMEEEFAEWAYKDTAFKIAAGQTISQPFTVAFMTQLMKIKGGEKVLEIGTGSGYQASILAYLGAKVYTIERHEVLYQNTSKLLQNIGFGQIRTLYGDGYLGCPRFAPFDRIIVTAGATEIPNVLLTQLAIGGIMIIPFGEGQTQTMLKLTRSTENNFTKESFGDFMFVPFLSGTE